MDNRELMRMQQRLARLEKLVDQLTQPKSVARLFIGNNANFYLARLTAGWTGNTAPAALYDMDAVNLSTSITVKDTLEIFGTLGFGAGLYVVYQDGTYYALQAACGGTFPGG